MQMSSEALIYCGTLLAIIARMIVLLEETAAALDCKEHDILIAAIASRRCWLRNPAKQPNEQLGYAW